MWSVLIDMTFSGLANYACIQTQAQRFLCVENTKAAKKYFFNNKIKSLKMIFK